MSVWLSLSYTKQRTVGGTVDVLYCSSAGGEELLQNCVDSGGCVMIVVELEGHSSLYTGTKWTKSRVVCVETVT